MATKETYRQPSGAAQAGSIQDWEKLKARLETDYENLGAKKFEEKHGNSYRSMLTKVNDALKDATFKGRAQRNPEGYADQKERRFEGRAQRNFEGYADQKERRFEGRAQRKPEGYADQKGRNKSMMSR